MDSNRIEAIASRAGARALLALPLIALLALASSGCKTDAGCPTGEITCDGRCIDPLTDRAFCGASGNCVDPNAGSACAAGEVCSAGVCAVSCQTGLVLCNGLCTNPNTDRDHCGATSDCAGANAGDACGAGEVCSAGTCGISCQTGLVLCNGVCTNPNTDRDHCGATNDCAGANAGTTCASGEVCADGQCAPSCPVGQLACNGSCIDPDTDAGHCGATADCAGTNVGSVCVDGEVCAAGLCVANCAFDKLACNGSCIDPSTDRAHCGATADCSGMNAGTVCASGEICSAGVCTVSCPGTQIVCNGACVDPANDRAYCGATGDCAGANAGTSCASGEVCGNGQCATSCPATQVDCGGSCVDPLTNAQHCGASLDCAGANAGTTCASGLVCAAGQCVPDCAADRLACNGACIDPMSDRDHCGASADCSGANAGVSCAAGEVCSAGSCVLSCQTGLLACGGVCTDPQTDRAHCGASGDCSGSAAGATCATGEICSMGVCVTSCQAGLLLCGTTCIDPNTNPLYCGASGSCAGTSAGSVCATGRACVSGTCNYPTRLTNGSFEEDYWAWTLTSTNGTWAIGTNGQVVTNGSSLYDYVDLRSEAQTSIGLPRTVSVTNGTKAALQFQSSSGVHRMYQDVRVPAGTTTLRWSMSYNNTNSSFVAGRQDIRITLRDPATDVVLATVFVTNPGDALVVATMTTYTADLSAYVGQPVRISVDLNVQLNWFDVTLDDFGLQ